MPKSKIQQLMDARKGLNVAPPVYVGGEPEAAIAADQEPSNQIEEIVRSTTTTEKSDIDWSAIAAGLQQEIENTRSQIRLLENELAVAREKLSESREALTLLQTPTKWEPSEKFELFHELKRVVDDQQNEQQRLEKLKQIEMAIASGDKLIVQREKQLTLLQRELAELEESEEWCRIYAPHIRRFESAYRHSQDQEDLIRRYKSYLEGSQKLLTEARAMQQKGSVASDQWVKATIYESMEAAIAAYEGVVEKHRKQLEDASRRDEKRFKAFIQARVDIDANLQEFLKTQKQYEEASAAFFAQLEKNWQPLELSKDEVFRLANLRLPQIRDVDGQVRVV
jgi:hypothetical protein